MQIIKDPRFDNELKVIVDFIAEDSVVRALNFFDELVEKIYKIPHNPYAFRKRRSSNDGKTRELIFKGYTVPFFIDNENNTIVILGIFNQNLWS